MTEDSQIGPDPKASGGGPKTNAVSSRDDATVVTVRDSEMSEPPTLRQLFAIPAKASDKRDDLWKAFQDKLAEETRGIKWTAAMPDLGSKICDLLDIKIHEVMLTAWKKVEAVRQAIEDSKKNPDKASYLDLTEHSIDYETKPFIDVKIKSASVKKLTLTVNLNLQVKGFSLKVQNGAIRELQTGKCEGKGSIKYEKLLIAEKKLEPIKFPLTIEIPSSIALPVNSTDTSADISGPETAAVAEPKDLKPLTEKPSGEEELERIEL